MIGNIGNFLSLGMVTGFSAFDVLERMYRLRNCCEKLLMNYFLVP